MKKIFFYLFVIALMPIWASAQEVQMDEEGSFSIGIGGGYDNNINAYRQYANSYGNEFSSMGPSYNIALNFGYMVNEKFRPRLELKRTVLGYKASWSGNDATYRTKTEVDLRNFDINFHLDYLLAKTKRFHMFVSPGLTWEFNYKRKIKNYLTNPDLDGATHNHREYNNIIKENPKNIVGGSISAIFKYNITSHVGITLTPEYTLFFRQFVLSNDKTYQRLSANVGFEFKF